MKHMKKEKIYLGIVIAVALLSALPLVGLAKYSHPSADDYYYATRTYQVWQESHSVFQVIGVAFSTSAEFYQKWQGLYASAVVQSLEPGIFGEKYYGLSGLFILLCLYATDIFAAEYLLHVKLKAGKLESMAFGCVLAFMMIQWMPSVAQGIYWFNGAANYTLFFCVLLLLFCAVISLAEHTSKSKTVGKLALAAVLAVVLAGGNHVTTFGGILLLVGCTVFAWIRKNRLFAGKSMVVLAFLIAGFLVNLLSPGTAARRAEFENTPGVIASVWAAIKTGFSAINSWWGLPFAIVLVIMLPFVFSAVRRICVETSFEFGHPLSVFVLSVGFVCALFCPSIYAMGTTGDLRLKNVIYFSFVILVFVNEFYICGWVTRRYLLDKMPKTTEEFLTGGQIVTALLLTVGLFVASGESLMGYQAYLTLKGEEAVQYSAQADARYELLSEAGGEDVTVPAFSSIPWLFYQEDITEDADDWRNQWMAAYFNVNSIVCKETE